MQKLHAQLQREVPISENCSGGLAKRSSGHTQPLAQFWLKIMAGREKSSQMLVRSYEVKPLDTVSLESNFHAGVGPKLKAAPQIRRSCSDQREHDARFALRKIHCKSSAAKLSVNLLDKLLNCQGQGCRCRGSPWDG